MDKAALTRFKVAFKSFLHAMSDEHHPIVIFIDNVQWANEGLQHILAELLLKDKDLHHMLSALTYCDKEATSTERLLQYAHGRFVDVRVGSLCTTSAFKELPADQMGLPSQEQATSKVKELSKLVMLKMQDNPFHGQHQ
jgi:predicted ATPase